MPENEHIKADQRAGKTFDGPDPYALAHHHNSVPVHLRTAGAHLDDAQRIFRTEISATENMTLPAMKAMFALIEATKGLHRTVTCLALAVKLDEFPATPPLDFDRITEALSRPDDRERVVLPPHEALSLTKGIERLTAQRNRLRDLLRSAIGHIEDNLADDYGRLSAKNKAIVQEYRDALDETS